MDTQSKPLALIIGASRGLGLALTEEYLRRGWQVVATVRGTSRTGLHELAERSAGRLQIEQVDMVEPEQVEGLKNRLAGGLYDLLLVNAGIALGPADCVRDISTGDFVRIMLTNTLSPMRVVESLGVLVAGTGTIAVMSSELGSVAANTQGGWEVYRASKAALNTLMRSYAARHPQGQRPLVLVCPGWVRTEMGGSTAALSIEESIPPVVDVLLSRHGKPGLVYLDRHGEAMAW